MKISGTATVAAPRERVWEALQDPAVLARTLPGCEALEVTGPDAYAATVTAGVASVKGTYAGQVQLTDKQAPSRYRMKASGSGGPGTISADAEVRLEDDGNGHTIIHYDADAIVGGMLGGVGQRMLSGVAKKTAGEFFAAVERELTGVPAEAEEAVPAAGEAVPVGVAAAPQVGQVFRAPAAAPAAADAQRRLELIGAVLLGAAIALIGVLIGRRTAR